MTKEEKTEEVMELAKKALNSQTRTLEMHLAICYMAGQTILAIKKVWGTDLTQDEKRKQIISSFDIICNQASIFFPYASEFIEKLQKSCLDELRKGD